MSTAAPAMALVAMMIAAPAIGAEVRSASELEIAEALVGCWAQEMYAQEYGSYSLCFSTDGSVLTSWGGYREGGDDTVPFSLAGGVLRFAPGSVSPWGVAEVSCDVVMRIGVAMRMENCIAPGEPSEQLPNVSFGKVVQ